MAHFTKPRLRDACIATQQLSVKQQGRTVIVLCCSINQSQRAGRLCTCLLFGARPMAIGVLLGHRRQLPASVLPCTPRMTSPPRQLLQHALHRQPTLIVTGIDDQHASLAPVAPSRS